MLVGNNQSAYVFKIIDINVYIFLCNLEIPSVNYDNERSNITVLTAESAISKFKRSKKRLIRSLIKRF